MLAEEKGVPYRLEETRPRTEEATKIHPFGKIPSMRHGETFVCESSAIARYIDMAFEGPKFFPDNAAEAANVEEWVSLHTTVFDQTMIRQYGLAYVFPGEDGVDRARVEATLEPMEKQFKFINDQLADGFLACGRLTYADMALFPTLEIMRRFPESKAMMADLADLNAFIDKMADRDSAKKTVAPK